MWATVNGEPEACWWCGGEGEAAEASEAYFGGGSCWGPDLVADPAWTGRM